MMQFIASEQRNANKGTILAFGRLFGVVGGRRRAAEAVLAQPVEVVDAVVRQRVQPAAHVLLERAVARVARGRLRRDCTEPKTPKRRYQIEDTEAKTSEGAKAEKETMP